MKLAYVDICGFRGYQKRVCFQFADGFTIVDGRNGVGKSTVFDAVEFALTGTISKYQDARASGEGVENYLWWSGPGATAQRYVEVGFRDHAAKIHAVKRTPRDGRSLDIAEVSELLVDRDRAPKSAVEQLCSATIIRDELIAQLSLDLTETDRFALLRDAIGAPDADAWIGRAQRLHSNAASRVKAVQDEVTAANAAVLAARRQIDQARSAIPTTSTINEAAARLREVLRTTAPTESLGDVARARLAELARRTTLLDELSGEALRITETRDGLPKLSEEVKAAKEAYEVARADFEEKQRAIGDAPVSSALSEQARQLEQLVTIGRLLGLRDGGCPLCASEIDHAHFEEGMNAAIAVAKKLDADAVEQAQRERARDSALQTLTRAEDRLKAAETRCAEAQAAITAFEDRCTDAGLQSDPRLLTAEQVELSTIRASITADLRTLETVSLNRLLIRATEDEGAARERVARAEARLGRARIAETRAKAIFDATRRAAAETLDQRLDRVLPLMSELYRRLRPHPIWTDIEYSVRGDVRRFLRLQVGDEVNPQFVFSSGQRRATGLAFLLSINLSIAWSRWRSILLDDPVQHVDDFHTVQLAEVLSHICAGGRQIVCAVEDSALADLMCRRLPTKEQSAGKRITLGTDQDGALAITSEKMIPGLVLRALTSDPRSLSA
jgi:chromosome segregation protein